jgi:DNA-binding transcriptional regulator GbsR (MarR family)
VISIFSETLLDTRRVAPDTQVSMSGDSPQPTSLSPAQIAAQDRFVAVWGQMGGAWGISRTMAEVHALLFIVGEPMCTDDVMDRLQISRGNASMSLRALVEWSIVSRTHVRGDRKEYFKAEQDVWAMFRAIVRERMKREVDPLLASLHEIRDMTGRDEHGKAVKRVREDATLAAHHKRINDLLEFFGAVERVSQAFVSPAGRGLRVAATLLSKLHEAATPRTDRSERVERGER